MQPGKLRMRSEHVKFINRNGMNWTENLNKGVLPVSFLLGPNIHWTSNCGTGIVFIGNMLSWLSFHNFV